MNSKRVTESLSSVKCAPDVKRPGPKVGCVGANKYSGYILKLFDIWREVFDKYGGEVSGVSGGDQGPELCVYPDIKSRRFALASFPRKFKLASSSRALACKF